MYLHQLENATEYIHNLIIKDRLERGDPEFINQQIQKKKEEIQKLQDLKKQGSINQEEIHKILKFYAKNYQNQAMSRTDNQRYRFCEKTVLPNLKKFGYKGSSKDIDDILLNFPEEEI